MNVNRVSWTMTIIIMLALIVAAWVNSDSSTGPEGVTKKVPLDTTQVQLRIVKVHPPQQFHGGAGEITTVRPLETADEKGYIRMIFDYADTFVGKPEPGMRIFADLSTINDYMGKEQLYHIVATYLITEDKDESP